MSPKKPNAFTERGAAVRPLTYQLNTEQQRRLASLLTATNRAREQVRRQGVQVAHCTQEEMLDLILEAYEDWTK